MFKSIGGTVEGEKLARKLVGAVDGAGVVLIVVDNGLIVDDGRHELLRDVVQYTLVGFDGVVVVRV